MESKRVEFILSLIKDKENEIISLANDYASFTKLNLFTGEISEKIENLRTEMDLLTNNLLNYENPKPSNT